MRHLGCPRLLQRPALAEPNGRHLPVGLYVLLGHCASACWIPRDLPAQCTKSPQPHPGYALGHAL